MLSQNEKEKNNEEQESISGTAGSRCDDRDDACDGVCRYDNDHADNNDRRRNHDNDTGRGQDG